MSARRELTADEEQAITALRPIFEAIDRLRNEVEQLHEAAMTVIETLVAGGAS
jgi:hypothetical protein